MLVSYFIFFVNDEIEVLKLLLCSHSLTLFEVWSLNDVRMGRGSLVWLEIDFQFWYVTRLAMPWIGYNEVRVLRRIVCLKNNFLMISIPNLYVSLLLHVSLSHSSIVVVWRNIQNHFFLRVCVCVWRLKLSFVRWTFFFLI